MYPFYEPNNGKFSPQQAGLREAQAHPGCLDTSASPVLGEGPGTFLQGRLGYNVHQSALFLPHTFHCSDRYRAGIQVYSALGSHLPSLQADKKSITFAKLVFTIISTIISVLIHFDF